MYPVLKTQICVTRPQCVNTTKYYILATQGIYVFYTYLEAWSQWPRGLSRRSAAARLLKSWVRIPSGAWMFVC